MRTSRWCLLGCMIAVACQSASGMPVAPFGEGNPLLLSDNKFYESTPTGEVLQSVVVPTSNPTYYECCDLVMHPSGDVLVLNRDHGPVLSTYRPSSGVWTHETFADWDVVNGVECGGIATKGSYVYVSDAIDSYSDPGGVVRFDRNGGPTIRTSASRNVFDVAVGLDGLLYAMSPSGSPEGYTVSVFNPDTLALIRDVYIGGDNTGLAVDADGSMFVVDFDGLLLHLGPDGTLLDQMTLPSSNSSHKYFNDIDLRPDGAIAVGQRFGCVVLTDRDFSFATAFQGPTGQPTKVAFVVVPEPSILGLIVIGLPAVLTGRRRGLK